jgi:uncharacterized protein
MTRTLPIAVILLSFALPLVAQEASRSEAFFNAVRARDADSVRSMLDADPTLADAVSPRGNSVTIVALMAVGPNEEGIAGFYATETNAVLQAILARKPRFGLTETAALGSAQALEAMLRADPGAVNQYDRTGWTALHIAAFAGNVATTTLLISKGANVNARAKTKWRNTPLQTAVLTSAYDTAKVLLENGADPLARQAQGVTPMHEAARHGRAEVIQLLLESGAEINSRMDDGKTPLAWAMEGHRDQLAAMLRAKGAVAGDTFPPFVE